MMTEGEIKQALEDKLGLKGDQRITIMRSKDEVGASYRMQLYSGAVVDLGPASQVIKFGKVQAAFAESIGHVVLSKESKNWDSTAQLLLDLYKEMKKDYRQEEALPAPEDGFRGGDKIRCNYSKKIGYITRIVSNQEVYYQEKDGENAPENPEYMTKADDIELLQSAPMEEEEPDEGPIMHEEDGLKQGPPWNTEKGPPPDLEEESEELYREEDEPNGLPDDEDS